MKALSVLRRAGVLVSFIDVVSGHETEVNPVAGQTDPVDLLGSIYQLAGIDPHARLPHPLGIEAQVLPAPSDKVKSGGLLTEIM